LAKALMVSMKQKVKKKKSNQKLIDEESTKVDVVA
jgi:hypothetical protein